jgi:hypothetical protein
LKEKETKSSSEFDGDHSFAGRFPLTNSHLEEAFILEALIRKLHFVFNEASEGAEFFTECFWLPNDFASEMRRLNMLYFRRAGIRFY